MKKARFKVGDKVKILDGSKIGNYIYGWACDMPKYIGKIATIKSNPYVSGDRFGYRVEEFEFVWDERGLAPACNETIVIYCKGNEVIALNKSTGKKAVAKCSPSDTFDFTIGARLAFDRLMIPKAKFKVGDRVIGNAEASEHYGIIGKGWQGKVIAVREPKNVGADDIRVEGNDGTGSFWVESEYFDLDDRIGVGDEVKIINTGKMYTTNGSWVTQNIEDITLIATYAYDDGAGYPDKKKLPDTFKVKFIKDNMAYVQHQRYQGDCHGKCYLIDLEGLEKC